MTESVAARVVLREFVLDYDEVSAGSVYRYQSFARLLVRHHYPDDDPNKWSFEHGNSAVSFDSSSHEQKARDRFNREVRRLRDKEREAAANELFAEGRYTLGTNIADADEPRPA